MVNYLNADYGGVHFFGTCVSLQQETIRLISVIKSFRTRCSWLQANNYSLADNTCEL